MRPRSIDRLIRLALVACVVSSTTSAARSQAIGDSMDGRAAPTSRVPAFADVAYGPAARQRLDVYLPAGTPDGAPATGAPLLVMVHGGAWMVGNKSMRNVVDNKAAHWLAQGWIFVSVGYRLVPQVSPRDEAADVARAVAKVQASARGWGGDPGRVVLMGHSAGAHLVALVSASPTFARDAGAAPWLGTVALDSAALDLTRLMQAPHPRFYDRVFGSDAAVWRTVSPTESLTSGAPPMLMVCSTLRPDDSCGQSRRFVDRAAASNVTATLLPEALTHAEINAQLGVPGAYTAAVDAFIAGLMTTGGAPIR